MADAWVVAPDSEKMRQEYEARAKAFAESVGAMLSAMADNMAGVLDEATRINRTVGLSGLSSALKYAESVVWAGRDLPKHTLAVSAIFVMAYVVSEMPKEAADCADINTRIAAMASQFAHAAKRGEMAKYVADMQRARRIHQLATAKSFGSA
jgi:hypothetical protein